MSKEVKAKLFKAYDCKHSVRYNADAPVSKETLASLYLSNAACDELEHPKGIEVTIRAIE